MLFSDNLEPSSKTATLALLGWIALFLTSPAASSNLDVGGGILAVPENLQCCNNDGHGQSFPFPAISDIAIHQKNIYISSSAASTAGGRKGNWFVDTPDACIVSEIMVVAPSFTMSDTPPTLAHKIPTARRRNAPSGLHRYMKHFWKVVNFVKSCRARFAVSPPPEPSLFMWSLHPVFVVEQHGIRTYKRRFHAIFLLLT